jgi:hypothetical protein
LGHTQIKAFEKFFFMYRRGSYPDGNILKQGYYDGYCRQYDKINTLVLNEIYSEDNGFIGIGGDGVLYYAE